VRVALLADAGGWTLILLDDAGGLHEVMVDADMTVRQITSDGAAPSARVLAGMWAREMQRLGVVRRAIVVCPANLASKWVEDFERFFGGGLRHLTSNTVREDAVGHGPG